MAKDVAEDYASSLADLTVNSKPLINMLTMLADDYSEHAPTIVRTVEAHLQKVSGDIKLPVLYLIDSIVKNVGREYVSLFTQNIVSTFCSVFEQVDEKVRSQMFKLRQTWNEVFPGKKLYALDARVNSIDPAWPITAQPPTPRIHVNPKFFNTVPPPAEPVPTTAPGPLPSITDTTMREELLKRQKELLELQKRKVELELLQTKAILEEQQKKLENQTSTRVPDVPATPAPPQPYKIPKIKTAHSETAESSVTKPKPAEEKPEKSKFEGTKRRDPRLHSRKETDPRLNSRKENQQSQDGPTNLLSMKKDLGNKDDTKHKEEPRHKEDLRHKEDPRHKDETSDAKKSNDNTSGLRGMRHPRKKNDRYKKHREPRYKPRMKTLFGDSPENREAGSSLKYPKKPAEVLKSSNIPPIPHDSFSTIETPAAPSIIIENTEKDSIRHETKDANMDKDYDITEVSVIQKPPTEPSTISPIIDLVETSFGSETEPVPMEIDEKPNDVVQPNFPLPEKISSVFNIDEPPILKSIKENDLIMFPADKSSDLPLTACGDTDLRLLPSSQSANSDSEQPPEKKAKSDMQLFGVEDVDLRQSLVPIPPPPPIISKSDFKHSEGWANFKRSNSDRGSSSSGKSPKKRRAMVSSPRSSCFRHNEDEMSTQDTLDNKAEDRQNSLMVIIKDAEEQLKNGSITYSQYNQMLKGVMSMNEEIKLKEALLKDDYERTNSPASDSNSSADVQHHFDDPPPESMESYRSQSGGGEVKPGTDDHFTEHLKNSTDATDHPSNDHDTRRRSRFKNHDQYNRSKNSRNLRFYNQNDPPYFVENNKPWMNRPQMPPFGGPRSRKEMGHRWQFSHNRQKPNDYPVAVSLPRMRRPNHHPEISLPPADPSVLGIIDNDPMTYVNVGNSPKEVRFYGENAIIMMDWDDPRDLMFHPGSRRVHIDGVDVLTLQFNVPYREYTLSYGLPIRIRLGAPTRELFIDGRFYEVKFGGPPIEVNLGGRNHLIQLEGPMPILNIGSIKRTDLVAGKVHLIIDGNIDNLFPIYLDAKPQRFEINGIPFIIRFVESLQTVVINGQPLKIPFGGIPVPIFFRNERHFLRLTTLPPNITPGFVNILNMEGGRLTPPPRTAPPPQPAMMSDHPPLAPPTFMNQPKNYEFQGGNPSFPLPAEFPQYSVSSNPEKPVDLFTSLIPFSVPKFAVQNYQIEPHHESQLPSAALTAPISSSSNLPTTGIDVIELYQKLVAMGVVPNQNKDKEKEEPEDKLAIKPVDFSKPETLKLKQPGLISMLYSGIQCSSCGVRFSPEQTVKYSQHLDWHFRQNRRERHSTRIAQSRRWNYDVSDWIQYQEIEDEEDRAQSWFEIQDKKSTGEEEEESFEPTVSAKGFGENPCCTVCRDRFDQFFNEDKEEWQLKRAVCVEEKLYHPLCLKDEQESQGKDFPPVMMPVPEDEPIETIDLEAVGDSGEEEKQNNIDTIDLDSTSKSPEENDNKDKVEENLEENESKDVDIEPEKEDMPNESEKEQAEEKIEEIEEEKLQEVEKTQEEKEEVVKPVEEDSDDDILEIEVIEPHIESYDILDDDEEEELAAEQEKNEEKSSDANEEKKIHENEEVGEIEGIVEEVKIKTEPIDLVNPGTNSNTSHINETIYLDGNSELNAPKILIPKKIKINISSVITKHNTDDGLSNETLLDHDEDSTENPTLTYDHREPLPPGEETVFTSTLKPRLIGKRMLEMPPINKGKEMSGLCSIM